jgi:anti-sigma regulatory factor (Ser/Thr protein kinase)
MKERDGRFRRFMPASEDSTSQDRASQRFTSQVQTGQVTPGNSSARAWTAALRRHSTFVYPVAFVGAFTAVGTLFAAQEWLNIAHAGYNISAAEVFASWETQYFIWGVICWVLWNLFRPFIQNAGIVRMVVIGLPVSVACCLMEEMIWVLLFPRVPVNRPPMPYWSRVGFNFKGDMAESMAIFWCAFFFFRGIGYYQQLREKETVAAQLGVQLANAKIAALRMQLNPHFLFNTMNSISSLMRSDIEAADSLLEQLSSLLRMTLERRDVQLIPLHDEIEFTETYLAMQDRRYAGRVTRTLTVDPKVHDALVPAMILQPIVENAYVHGLSKLSQDGHLAIEVGREGQRLKAQITNSGVGLRAGKDSVETGSASGSDAGAGNGARGGHGVGLANIKNRLRLHYGESCTFSIRELDRARVQVSFDIPLQLSTNTAESLTRFGA